MLLKMNIIKICGGNIVENLAKIAEQLEVLRAKLNEEITKNNGLDNNADKILKISQELDSLILEYQKNLNKE